MFVSLTIYIGLDFVSKYNFAKYSPIIPKQSNCIPELKSIIHASDGQPATGSPYINVLTKITITNITDIIKNIKPIKVDIIKGIVEKDTIPSIPYFNKLKNDHFVLPFFLKTLLYSIYSTL